MESRRTRFPQEQYNRAMASSGMSSKYLKDLQQVLEAEAKLAREGVHLLADPEYRALRELFTDGDMTIEEFVIRVEALAAIRPEEGEEGEVQPDEDGAEAEADLDDLDDLEDIQVLKNLRELDGMDDSDPVTDDPDR